jgi:hypothetical protein
VERFGHGATGNCLSKTGTAYSDPASSHRLSSVGSTART